MFMRMISLFPLALLASLSVPALALAEAGQITVTGNASVQAAPDMASVSLGVTTTGTTAAEALTANSAALQAVLDRLAAAGIEAKDIQTSNLSVNPNYQSYDGSSPQVIQNYSASNMLTVTVRKLDTTGAVLDAAVKDGANTLNGLTFGLSDPRPNEDAARKAAVADAMARAKLLAEAAGAHLGTIVSISEGGVYAPPLPMATMKMDAAPAVPLASGTLDIQAAVTMVFELAP
jgi:uncharacterized protein